MSLMSFINNQEIGKLLNGLPGGQWVAWWVGRLQAQCGKQGPRVFWAGKAQECFG